MLGDDAVLLTYLEPLAALLKTEGLRELVINDPGKVMTEDADGWSVHLIPVLDYKYLRNLATACASYTSQDVTEVNPVCSTVLVDGSRCQIVVPPAVPDGTISFTIRKPSVTTWSMEDLASRGLFSNVRTTGYRGDNDEQLVALRNSGQWVEFLQLAVASKKNILISGATGSGKTTLAKSLVFSIPDYERVITIEDTREITVPA